MPKQQFGILAYPASHSLSPLLHNQAFAACGLSAQYNFFEIPPAKLAEFFQKVREEKIAGLSVSLPHKVTCRAFLDECEEAAEKIGAVNTVFWHQEKLVGTNTDFGGALAALQTKIDPAQKKIVVLGGGGAARAVVFALQQAQAQAIQIITRELAESAGLQKDFGVPTDTIANLANYKPEILINTTPLGMRGELEGQSFVPSEFFTQCQPLVFDIVYTPKKTRLLQDAQAAGCLTIPGSEMFLQQAIRQFEIWTKQPAPIKTMRQTLEKNL